MLLLSSSKKVNFFVRDLFVFPEKLIEGIVSCLYPGVLSNGKTKQNWFPITLYDISISTTAFQI